MAAAGSPPRVVVGVSASLAAEAHDVETWLRGNNNPSTIWDTLAAAQLADADLPYTSSPSKSGLEVAAEERRQEPGAKTLLLFFGRVDSTLLCKFSLPVTRMWCFNHYACAMIQFILWNAVWWEPTGFNAWRRHSRNLRSEWLTGLCIWR